MRGREICDTFGNQGVRDKRVSLPPGFSEPLLHLWAWVVPKHELERAVFLDLIWSETLITIG